MHDSCEIQAMGCLGSSSPAVVFGEVLGWAYVMLFFRK